MPTDLTSSQRRAIVTRILTWYEGQRRDLPWRHPEASPWSIMVSEFMLQQTPVSRVLEPWRRWMQRWPTPPALAAEPAGEAVRAWGRLGYPRRAIRLHAAATIITDEFDGEIPTSIEKLRSLPGVGDYTAAAIASFAFGQRHVVLDTNVRRVLARIAEGVEFPPPSPSRAEYAEAQMWLPSQKKRAARWAAASMELGALVCTAQAPACATCPVHNTCAWFTAGRPPHDGPPRRGQSYAGTDRQCRGFLLAKLRDSDHPWDREDLLDGWPDRSQAERCRASLLDDGLATESSAGIHLPH